MSVQARVALSVTLLSTHHRFWQGRWYADASSEEYQISPDNALDEEFQRQHAPAEQAARAWMPSVRNRPLQYALLHYLLAFKPTSRKAASAEHHTLALLFGGLVRSRVFAHDAYVGVWLWLWLWPCGCEWWVGVTLRTDLCAVRVATLQLRELHRALPRGCGLPAPPHLPAPTHGHSRRCAMAAGRRASAQVKPRTAQTPGATTAQGTARAAGTVRTVPGQATRAASTR